MLSQIPVFVLTVLSFTDRHKSIRAQAERFGFTPEWIFEYDASDLTADDNARFADGVELPDPTKSLVLKHFRAMELIVERRLPFALILEDDAIFFSDAVERFEKICRALERLPSSWLIFLGGADNKIDDRFLSSDKNELIEAPITTTESYLVDLVGCEKRLCYVAKDGIRLPSDHQLQLIDPILGITQYKLADPLCSQGSITGLFDTELDGNRKRHSKAFIKLRYTYNRLRRQLLPRFMKWLRSRGV